jgi:hypothetical protein
MLYLPRNPYIHSIMEAHTMSNEEEEIRMTPTYPV